MKLSNWGFKRKCVLNGAVVGESTGSCVSFRDLKNITPRKERKGAGGRENPREM